MKINIKGTGISLTASISEYINKKVGMLDKFFGEENVLVNVEVGRTTRHHKSGDIFRAEIRINYNSQEYYAVSETEDLYASIDEVKDEIVQELTKKRKKYLHLFKRGGAQIKNLMRGIVDIGDKSWKRFRRK
jgi:putative sigma-54 modulation protein